MKFLYSLLIIVLLLSSCTTLPEIQKESSQQPAYTEIPPDTAEEAQITETKEETEEKKTAVDKPAELTPEMIERQILDTIPGSFAPVVKKDGRIEIIYHDLDRNGYMDAFFLVIKKQKGISGNIETLSDISRLAEKDTVMVDYFLSVFLQIKGKMISMYRIPIGSRLIFDSISPLFIRKGYDYPFGLKIRFLTERGIDEEWIIFSSYNRFSFFNTENDTSAAYEFSDIDNDGFTDIVEWKHGLEEGTGYETYLTWYKWNGREYREKAATNVVRNLNKFLKESSLEIMNSKWESFFKNRLSGNDYGALENSNISPAGIFDRIFIPDKGTPLSGCINFRSVFFPQIFENPFSSKERVIEFMVRFDCRDGSTVIRSVKIAMNPNPFGNKQFYFILN